jgi:hypothetical protein
MSTTAEVNAGLFDEVKLLKKRIAELEKERDDLQECFDTCYAELGATRNAHDRLEKAQPCTEWLDKFIDELYLSGKCDADITAWVKDYLNNPKPPKQS